MESKDQEQITTEIFKGFAREFKKRLDILNNNSWVVYYLYKKAYFKEKRYPEAFLYFFYSLELALKHFIMTEMMVKNTEKFFEDKKTLSLVYPLAEINGIIKIGKISKLIEMFCLLCGNKVEDDLKLINRERNFIIHNMMKERLDEKRVEKSFENFFEKTESARVNYYRFCDNFLASRPQRILNRC